MGITIYPSLEGLLGAGATLVSGLLGALVGGYIAHRTTKKFHDIELRQKQVSLAISLTLRLTNATNGILSIRREVSEMLGKHGNEALFPLNEFWVCMLPLVGVTEESIVADPEELSLFADGGEAEFVMDMLDLLNLHNILTRSVHRYNLMRERLADALTPVTVFENNTGGLAGSTSFSAEERPDLVRIIGETNNLAAQIVRMVKQGKDKSDLVVEKFNAAMDKKFSKEEFPIRLGKAA